MELKELKEEQPPNYRGINRLRKRVSEELLRYGKLSKSLLTLMMMRDVIL